MTQKKAYITSSDIMRIIERDFPLEERANVSNLLKDYDDYETYRVLAAILKLSDGNVDLIKRYLKMAKNDYRDVICFAEYPRDTEWGLKERSVEMKDKINKDDWEEYEAWLNKA